MVYSEWRCAACHPPFAISRWLLAIGYFSPFQFPLVSSSNVCTFTAPSPNNATSLSYN
jgi:hypothetical protein